MICEIKPANCEPVVFKPFALELIFETVKDVEEFLETLECSESEISDYLYSKVKKEMKR